MCSDLHSYWLLCDKCDLHFVLSRQRFATLNASFVFTKIEGYGCRIILTCPTSSSEFSFRRGRKACGVSQRRHTAIQHALTIFVRDSYDRLIHFSTLIVITVDSRRRDRCHPQICHYSLQDLFHPSTIYFSEHCV